MDEIFSLMTNLVLRSLKTPWNPSNEALRRKFHTVKIPCGENFIRREFRTAKTPYGDKTIRRKILQRKFLRRKFRPRVFLRAKYACAAVPFWTHKISFNIELRLMNSGTNKPLFCVEIGYSSSNGLNQPHKAHSCSIFWERHVKNGRFHQKSISFLPYKIIFFFKSNIEWFWFASWRSFMWNNRILEICCDSQVTKEKLYEKTAKIWLYEKRYNFESNQDYRFKIWYNNFKTGN